MHDKNYLPERLYVSNDGYAKPEYLHFQAVDVCYSIFVMIIKNINNYNVRAVNFQNFGNFSFNYGLP